MDPTGIGPPAAIRPQADQELERLAEKINARERRSEEDQLAHAREQGNDLRCAKTEFTRRSGKRGGWQSWVRQNLDLHPSRVRHYLQFARAIVTIASHEDQWAEWQRISGNTRTRPKGN